MINAKYSIGNSLNHVKDGDLVFHTKRGFIEIDHVTDEYIYDNVGTKFDKNGKYPTSILPVLFESIIAAINYLTYYQHFMTNDRNLDPRMNDPLNSEERNFLRFYIKSNIIELTRII